MLKKTFALYCAIFSFLLPSVVYAATLKNIQGVVKVNKGDGYHTVEKSITVNPGGQHIMDQTGSFVSAIDPAAAAAISLSRDDKPASP